MRATYGLLAVLLLGQTGSSDIPFKLQKIDAGQSEAAALVDVNNDGRLDILSSEHLVRSTGLDEARRPEDRRHQQLPR